MNKLNVTFKLLAPMLAVLVLALAGFGLVQDKLANESMTAQLLQTTEGIGQSLGAAFVNSMAKRDVEGIKATIAQVALTPGIRRIYVTDDSGKVHFSSKPEALGQTVAEIHGGATETFARLDSSDAGDPFVLQMTPFKSEKRCHQCHDASLKNIGYLGVEFSAAAPLRAMVLYSRIYWAWSGVLVLALGLVLTFIVRFFISRPLLKLVPVARKAAGGDLDVAELEVSSGDEIAILADTINRMSDHLRDLVGKVAERTALLKTAADGLTATSVTMTQVAEETSSRAVAVSSAGEEVNKSTSTVAAGVEEMSSSIKEISRNSAAAAKVAGDAVKLAEQTSAVMAKLGESSADIGKVVKLISTISGQTNLLALNASIEAAGAGEAGRGFAVVAKEVKELAKEAAKATEEISRKIEGIQDGTKNAVEAIAHIGTIIGQMSDISNSIASAIEEQTVTTSEISRNVSQVSQGSGEIAHNISGVASAAKSTAREAEETQKAAADLVRMAGDLDALTSKFNLRMTSFIEEAITAHRNWTKRLMDAIDGKGTLDVATVSADNQCALGKWIYGEGSRYSATSEYAELKKAHAEFHVAAGGVVSQFGRGDKDGARQETQHGAFRAKSQEVIKILARLKHSRLAA